MQVLARQTSNGPPAPSRLPVPPPGGAQLGDDVDSGPLPGARCFIPDAAHKPASVSFAGTYMKSEWLAGAGSCTGTGKADQGWAS